MYTLAKIPVQDTVPVFWEVTGVLTMTFPISEIHTITKIRL